MSIAEVDRKLDIALPVDGIRQPIRDRRVVVQSLLDRERAKPIVFVNEPLFGGPEGITRTIIGCVLDQGPTKDHGPQKLLIFDSGEFAVAVPPSEREEDVLLFQDQFVTGMRIYGRNFEGDKDVAVRAYTTPGSDELTGLPYLLEKGHNDTHSSIDMTQRHGLIFEALRTKKK